MARVHPSKDPGKVPELYNIRSSEEPEVAQEANEDVFSRESYSRNKIVSSFSGVDITALAALRMSDGKVYTVKLGTLQTISFSVFREKMPVRAIGFVGAKGYTRGTRTVAGSMVFTVFDRNAFFDLMRRNPLDPPMERASVNEAEDLAYMMPDQIPPFDIILMFTNELGNAAEMAILGIDLHSEGQVMSVNDIMTEATYQFTAQHAVAMRPGGYRDITVSSELGSGKKGFRSILSNGYDKNISALLDNSRRRFL